MRFIELPESVQAVMASALAEALREEGVHHDASRTVKAKEIAETISDAYLTLYSD